MHNGNVRMVCKLSILVKIMIDGKLASQIFIFMEVFLLNLIQIEENGL